MGLVGSVIKSLQTIGGMILLGVCMILGVNYMKATSIEEKARLKNNLILFFVGSITIFASTALAKAVIIWIF